MKSQKMILIFEIIFCLFVGVCMFLISHFIYADVFRINSIISCLTSWVVITLINWKKELITTHPKVRWFTILLIAITIFIFFIYKPNLSYEKGKNIVALQGYENITELQDKSIISFRLKSPSHFVHDVYLYAGEKNDVKYYILLNPIDGEIETEKMGEGNYLDKYFLR